MCPLLCSLNSSKTDVLVQPPHRCWVDQTKLAQKLMVSIQAVKAEAKFVVLYFMLRVGLFFLTYIHTYTHRG